MLKAELKDIQGEAKGCFRRFLFSVYVKLLVLVFEHAPGRITFSDLQISTDRNILAPFLRQQHRPSAVKQVAAKHERREADLYSADGSKVTSFKAPGSCGWHSGRDFSDDYFVPGRKRKLKLEADKLVLLLFTDVCLIPDKTRDLTKIQFQR